MEARRYQAIKMLLVSLTQKKLSPVYKSTFVPVVLLLMVLCCERPQMY